MRVAVGKVFIIARWEYLERVRSKVFLVSLILMPLVMIAMGVLPALFVGAETERERMIGIADMTGIYGDRFVTLFERKEGIDPGAIVIRFSGPADSIGKIRTDVDRQVMSGLLDGYCILQLTDTGGVLAEYRTRTVADGGTGRRIRAVLEKIVAEETLGRLGVPDVVVRWLETAVDVNTVVLSPEGAGEVRTEREFIETFFSAYVFLMMLFFMILSSGQLLVRSVVEEKMNRMVEILVSSVSPTELMAGKILGLSGLGFTQVFVWGILAAMISSLMSLEISVHQHIVLLLVYFVLGYLLYAAIFIAIGSPVNTEQEAQHVTSYLVIILVIPLVLTVPAIQDPGAAWITVLSYVPLLTPTMMGLRLALAAPSAVEIAGTVVIMLISIYLSMVVAGRIFRVAILSTGRRPSIRQMIRWVASDQ